MFLATAYSACRITYKGSGSRNREKEKLERRGKAHVDDTARSRSDTDVVDETHKLDVENWAFSYPPDVDTTPVLEVTIQSRLRTIRFLVYKDGLFGS
jgi:hypothetical protein